jgi:mono/diheme cytochrome c family protein
MKATVASLMIAGLMVSHPVGAQQDIVNAPEVQPSLMQGSALFKAYCAVCHGSGGKGTGPMAQSLKKTIPDLTYLATRNGGRFPLERVQKIISGEVQAGITHGTREMPVCGPVFSEVTCDRDIGRIRIYNLAKSEPREGFNKEF